MFPVLLYILRHFHVAGFMYHLHFCVGKVWQQSAAQRLGARMYWYVSSHTWQSILTYYHQFHLLNKWPAFSHHAIVITHLFQTAKKWSIQRKDLTFGNSWYNSQTLELYMLCVKWDSVKHLGSFFISLYVVIITLEEYTLKRLRFAAKCNIHDPKWVGWYIIKIHLFNENLKSN